MEETVVLIARDEERGSYQPREERHHGFLFKQEQTLQASIDGREEWLFFSYQITENSQ